jgi:hypothetical protein
MFVRTSQRTVAIEMGIKKEKEPVRQRRILQVAEAAIPAMRGKEGW